MEDDEGVVMPLYWACQEVQASLQQPNNNRKDLIIKSITEHLEKFGLKERINFDKLPWFNTNSSITR